MITFNRSKSKEYNVRDVHRLNYSKILLNQMRWVYGLGIR